jgi:hypothetical protein
MRFSENPCTAWYISSGAVEDGEAWVITSSVILPVVPSPWREPGAGVSTLSGVQQNLAPRFCALSNMGIRNNFINKWYDSIRVAGGWNEFGRRYPIGAGIPEGFDRAGDRQKQTTSQSEALVPKSSVVLSRWSCSPPCASLSHFFFQRPIFFNIACSRRRRRPLRPNARGRRPIHQGSRAASLVAVMKSVAGTCG